MIVLGGNITRSGATLHPEGHMNWWYSSSFTAIEPHLFTAIILMIPVAAVFFYYMGKSKAKKRDSAWAEDETEAEFQLLMDRKRLIMSKLIELEEAEKDGEITREEFLEKEKNHKSHLYETERKLHQLIDGDKGGNDHD